MAYHYRVDIITQHDSTRQFLVIQERPDNYQLVLGLTVDRNKARLFETEEEANQFGTLFTKMSDFFFRVTFVL